MSRWPTFVNMEIGNSMRILDLLHSKRYGWHVDHVARLFGLNLASRVLSIALPTHDIHDVSVEILLRI